MKLSRRLNALCEYIEVEAIVADIGCDHAQLCIHLVENNKCIKAYACDLNSSPLEQAIKNIKYYKLENSITACLSDGLAAIDDEVSDVVIAGMGFETIQMILEQHPEKMISTRKFIIQSNTDVEGLRRWISKHHYKIIGESVIYEDSHYYQMICFVCQEDTPLSESEIRFGRKMKKDFTFYSMWKYRLSKYENILQQLNHHHLRYTEIMNEMHFIYKEFGS